VPDSHENRPFRLRVVLVVLLLTPSGLSSQDSEPGLPDDVEARKAEFEKDPFFREIRYEVRLVPESLFVLFLQEPGRSVRDPEAYYRDQAEETGRHLVQLERYFVQEYARPLDLERRPGFGKLPIWILADRGSFVNYFEYRSMPSPPDGVRARYFPDERIAVTYRDPKALTDRSNLATTLHEATHFLTDLYAPAGVEEICSVWLREGLADYLAALHCPREKGGPPFVLRERIEDAQVFENQELRAIQQHPDFARLPAKFELRGLLEATDHCRRESRQTLDLDVQSLLYDEIHRAFTYPGGLFLVDFLDRSPDAPPKERVLAFLKDEISGRGGAGTFRRILAPDDESFAEMSRRFRKHVDDLYAGALRAFPPTDAVVPDPTDPATEESFVPEDVLPEVLGLAAAGRFLSARERWLAGWERADTEQRLVLEPDRALADALGRFGERSQQLLAAAGRSSDAVAKPPGEPKETLDLVRAMRKARLEGLDWLACAAACDVAGDAKTANSYLARARGSKNPEVASAARAYAGRRETYSQLEPVARAEVLVAEILAAKTREEVFPRVEDLAKVEARFDSPSYRKNLTELRERYSGALSAGVGPDEMLRAVSRAKIEPVGGGWFALEYQWTEPKELEDWENVPHGLIERRGVIHRPDPSYDWTWREGSVVGRGYASVRHRFAFEGDVDLEFEVSLDNVSPGAPTQFSFLATVADDGESRYAALLGPSELHVVAAGNAAEPKEIVGLEPFETERRYRCHLLAHADAVEATVDGTTIACEPPKGFATSGNVCFWAAGHVPVRLHRVRIVGAPSPASLTKAHRARVEKAVLEALPGK
jgi:hypothetical protein